MDIRYIDGYHEKYMVSEDSRVWKVVICEDGSRKLKGITQTNTGAGYLAVSLFRGTGIPRKNYLVHRLVAKYFIPGWFEGAEINHKNGIKTDNSIGNLEWCTRKYNMQHAWATGLIKPMVRVGNRIDAYSGIKIINTETKTIYESIKDCCKAMKCTGSRLRIWLHYGEKNLQYYDKYRAKKV
jgi:hypothetical protein